MLQRAHSELCSLISLPFSMPTAMTRGFYVRSRVEVKKEICLSFALKMCRVRAFRPRKKQQALRVWVRTSALPALDRSLAPVLIPPALRTDNPKRKARYLTQEDECENPTSVCPKKPSSHVSQFTNCTPALLAGPLSENAMDGVRRDGIVGDVGATSKKTARPTSLSTMRY